MFLSYVCLISTTVALITGASSQTTPAQEVAGSCNSCCQGPVGPQGNPGIPGVGIPGSHGTNGLPGSVGQKGEPGESIKGEPGASIKGVAGIKGEPGLGEKGECGDAGPRGSPGKVGPVGERGLDGERGLPGAKGERGLPGAKGERSLPGAKGERGVPGSKGEQGSNAVTRQSAFTAVKTSGQTFGTNLITFQTIITNIGNDFGTSTNKFTCRVPGVYVFMFNINADHDTADTVVYLMKNDEQIVGAVRDHQTDYSQQDNGVSGSAVLSLTVGDQVWLKLSSGDADSGAKGTNFSGYLLYEN